MRRLAVRGSVTLSLLAVMGVVLPSAAFARAPSHAYIHFNVPSTIGLFDASSTSTTAQTVISWRPGASNTGARCCTNKISDDGTLLGRTANNMFQTTIHVGGYQIGPYTIRSFDAHGAFVGPALADPMFGNDFEDAYINDHGADCNSTGGFSGSWSAVTNSDNEGGGSCATTTAGDSFTFSSGIANAWVTTTGPNEGSARIYIDGVYVQTVSTYSKTTHYRRLVWQHRFGSLGGHTITIVNLPTHGHPRLDVDADLFLSVD
jgi:hypothetical protein